MINWQYLNWLLFSFRGRASRKEFWAMQIATMLVLLIAFALLTDDPSLTLALIGQAVLDPNSMQGLDANMQALLERGFKVFTGVNVLMLWPNLAVEAKRWHDRNKSSWFILVKFIPYIGQIWYLVECGLLGSKAPQEPQPTTNSASADLSQDQPKDNGRFDA